MHRTQIDPQDAIDAIQSIAIKERMRCDWLEGWFSEYQMLNWAEESLEWANERGNADAVSWAKRSIACRIDRFLQLCYLWEVAPLEYPARLELLRRVNIDISDVVHELVFGPRNDLEHLYRMPSDNRVAARAVEIARLALSATRGYLDGDLGQRRCGCIALNWNVQYRHSQGRSGETIEVNGFADHPMIFIDVFEPPSPHLRKKNTKLPLHARLPKGHEPPVTINVVDPASDEIRFVPLSDFDKAKTVEFSLLMNQWSEGTSSMSESRMEPRLIRVVKERLGF